MDKHTLLVKTDKGREALARRSPELGPRLRSLLILVDGKRSVAELDRLGAGLGGGMPFLEQLVAQGWAMERDLDLPFQESVPFAESRPFADKAPSPEAPPSLQPGTDQLPFVDARRLVVRFVNDQLGPSGEALAIRIEGCKSAVDLLSLLPRVRESLKNYRDAAMVQRFDLEVVPRLPRL